MYRSQITESSSRPWKAALLPALAFIALAVLCGCRTTPSGKLAGPDAPTPAAEEPCARLAAGDRVSVRIQQDKEEPKLLVVSDSGELEAPHVGRLQVKNKSCVEVAQMIKEGLEKRFYHEATVVVCIDQLNRTRGTVYLSGEVRVPGAQPLPSDEVLTLARAIIRSGGFTDFANQRKVKVTRASTRAGPPQVFEVDVKRILRQSEVDKDLKLEAGDLIYVPERLLNF